MNASFCLRGTGQTDGRTDGWTAALHNVPIQLQLSCNMEFNSYFH